MTDTPPPVPPRITADFLNGPGLRQVIAMLENGGHQALIVGGAVRNALMGQPVADVDMASDAPPERVMRLAEAAGLRALPTGIDHGTVTVLPPDGAPHEITTFRRDVATDGRHATVAWSGDIAEDACRRDFTMNALYARGDGTVLDPVGGLADLRARRLRFVGDPAARIAEDYLRILRFFRFHAWYGQPGQADHAALAAIRALAPGMALLSKERIGAEMQKLLSAPDPVDAVTLMQDTGVLAVILPGADAGLLPKLLAAERRQRDKPDWLLRLAALAAADAKSALRLGNAEADQLAELARAQDDSLPRVARRQGETTARRLALLRLARGQHVPWDWTAAIHRAYTQVFPLRAADLMPELTGPALGHALKTAEDHWIDSDFQALAPELMMIAQAAGRTVPASKSKAKDA